MQRHHDPIVERGRAVGAASAGLGYFIASKLGLWRSVALFVLVDLTMLVVMRDNLATNVLMLLWPIDAVRRWQAGG